MGRFVKKTQVISVTRINEFKSIERFVNELVGKNDRCEDSIDFC